MSKVGIENLEEAAMAVLETMDVVDDTLADGKVNFNDLGQIMRLPSIISKFSSLGNVDDELFDLDSDEQAELTAKVKSKVIELNSDLESDKISLIAEKVILAAINLAGAVSLFTAKAA